MGAYPPRWYCLYTACSATPSKEKKVKKATGSPKSEADGIHGLTLEVVVIGAQKASTRSGFDSSCF